MEPSYSPKCSLCQTPILDNSQIKFSCEHAFCLKCFPYIIYNNLNEGGLNGSFFEDQRVHCLICLKGFGVIPIAKILTGPKMGNEKNTKLCKCKNKENIEKFCVVCKNGVCKLCLKDAHDGHEFIPIAQVYTKAENVNSEEVKAHFGEIKEKISKFKPKFAESILSSFDAQSKKFNLLVDNMIEILLKLKEKNQEKIRIEGQNLQNQFSLIDLAISNLQEEILQKDNLYPNKIFYLSNFFPSKEKKTFSFEPFELRIDIDKQFIAISETVNKFIQDFAIKPITKIREKGLLKIDNQSNLVSSSPVIFSLDSVEIFNKKPEILSQLAFNSFRNKSQVSCAFLIGDETFVVWPNSSDESYYHPLSIYNSTTGKVEKIIEQKNTLSVLSTYPSEATIDSKQLFYCGDGNGNMRIYQIEKSKSFSVFCEFEAFKGISIFSAALFDDKFNQISDKNDEKTFALVCSYDNSSPFRIFKITKGKASLISEIPNTFSQPCSVITFYYDEIQKKTNLFLGFQNSGVKFYDLTTKECLQSFASKGGLITSINFLSDLDDENKLGLLIYTSKNIVTIADLDTNKIIKETQLSDVKIIYDLCIWDKKKKTVIIAANNQDSLKIVSLEDMKVIKNLIYEKSCPVNILKAIKRDGNKIKVCAFIVNSFGNYPLLTFE